MIKRTKRTVTKKELIQLIAEKTGIHPTDVRLVLQTLLNEMTSTFAQGDRIEFRTFGNFEVIRRKAKIGRNPKKAHIAISIPARNWVKFNPGNKIKEALEEKNRVFK
jgi:nucleoid DNA-binding protein